MKRRIGIDARALLHARPTGVERVVFQLVDALARVAHPAHEYVLFVDEEPRGRLPRALPGELVVVPQAWGSLRAVADLWIAAQMRSAMAAHRLDAFLSPNTKFPLGKKPSFTMVHGLEWHVCPREYRASERVRQWVWFQLCSRFSAGMITFSRTTAGDIARVREGCAVPTCVVPEGVAPLFRRLAADERSPGTLARLGIRGPFVLSVASHEPRKNLHALVRAFARLRDVPHQLVLVGREGRGTQRVSACIRTEGLEARARLTGYLPEEDLVQLYNHADVFVYPSLYEGFGLPVLEAMACGAPVVTADRGATREVAGVAALLVDPDSVDDLAGAIARLLAEPALRTNLSEAGLARARAFSWDEMARGIVGFLDHQLGNGS